MSLEFSFEKEPENNKPVVKINSSVGTAKEVIENLLKFTKVKSNINVINVVPKYFSDNGLFTLIEYLIFPEGTKEYTEEEFVKRFEDFFNNYERPTE